MACILTRHLSLSMFGMLRINVYEQRFPVPINIQQHRTAIEVEWDNIPQATIKSLINSMTHCMRQMMVIRY
jgi:hypothetical protein